MLPFSTWKYQGAFSLNPEESCTKNVAPCIFSLNEMYINEYSGANTVDKNMASWSGSVNHKQRKTMYTFIYIKHSLNQTRDPNQDH